MLKKNNNLYVYETLSKDGAKLRHWKDFVRYYWNLLYVKISFRKLIIKHGNSKDIIDSVESKFIDFIKITEKKPYRLTCNKLFCFGKPHDYELANDWSKSKGFYCSQLVAAAYMYAGIMKVKYGAGKYRPGYFSLDKTNEYLCLNDNYELGTEFILDFTNML